MTDYCDLERKFSTNFFSTRRDVALHADRYFILGSGTVITDSCFTPIGGIILWSGAIANIPIGWALCDGAGGTPDLRDRFVIGAGSTYAVGDSGGSATKDLSHSHADGTLSTDVEPVHSHGAGSYATDSYVHRHYMVDATGVEDLGGGDFRATTTNYDTHDHDVTGTSGTGGSHSHDVTGNTASAGSATQDVLNPYYSLCFIMRIA